MLVAPIEITITEEQIKKWLGHCADLPSNESSCGCPIEQALREIGIDNASVPSGGSYITFLDMPQHVNVFQPKTVGDLVEAIDGEETPMEHMVGKHTVLVPAELVPNV